MKFFLRYRKRKEKGGKLEENPKKPWGEKCKTKGKKCKKLKIEKNAHRMQKNAFAIFSRPAQGGR